MHLYKAQWSPKFLLVKQMCMKLEGKEDVSSTVLNGGLMYCLFKTCFVSAVNINK